jgi:hypothetical protein
VNRLSGYNSDEGLSDEERAEMKVYESLEIDIGAENGFSAGPMNFHKFTASGGGAASRDFSSNSLLYFPGAPDGSVPEFLLGYTSKPDSLKLWIIGKNSSSESPLSFRQYGLRLTANAITLHRGGYVTHDIHATGVGGLLFNNTIKVFGGALINSKVGPYANQAVDAANSATQFLQKNAKAK